MAFSSGPTVTPDPVPSSIQSAIEADEDTNSTFGSEGGSTWDYGSITSSIYEYRQENGRTYHAYADGKYLVPNDQKEQERMDILYHAILTMFKGKSFFAPVKNPQRILDMCTGTGSWVMDVGDEYPEAHVIGIDLSPIQPKFMRPNVEFRVDDIELPWVFSSPFDLIHSRACSGFAIRSWPNYLAESYKNLVPGGWVEIQDLNLMVHSDDDSIPANSKVRKWFELTGEGMRTVGLNIFQTAAGVKSHVEDAGFINVTVKNMKLPISPWAKDKRLKDVGSYAMVSCLDDLTGVSLAVYTRILGWDREKLDLFLVDVKRDWMKRGVHAYWPLFVVYGQKPESNEKEKSVEREGGAGASAV